jgi:type IX secretion system PorP/SprF family membrane protein
MKKKTLIILLLSVCTGSAFSQFDAQLSQYMLHIPSYNPAAVGQSGMIDLTGQYRMNWVGFPGAGTTAAFTLNSPIRIGKTQHGLGLSFLDDKIGYFSNQAFHLQYAYRKPLSNGTLSVGTDIGFVSLGFSGDSIANHQITLGEAHNLTSDPEIPTSSVVGVSFDMSLGVMYTTDKWYAGLSYKHLNKPVIRWGDRTEFTQYGMGYLTGGLNLRMANPKYTIKPGMLLKTDFSVWSCDLSTRIDYDEKYWGGISYRLLDAVVLLGGVNIGSGLSIGYSVDISTNKLITSNYGSHEILLSYSFEYLFTKSTTKYKSIRFL